MASTAKELIKREIFYMEKLSSFFSIISLFIIMIASLNSLSFAQDYNPDFVPPVILHPDADTTTTPTDNLANPNNDSEEPSDWIIINREDYRNDSLPEPVGLPADLSLQGKLEKLFNISWHGEITTPSDKILKAHMFLKEGSLTIKISSKEYTCNDISLSEDNTFKFYIVPEDKSDLKLSFEGYTQNNNQITGKIYDPKGKEGSWEIYKTPMENWSYKSSYGDYLDTIEKELRKCNIPLKDYHFKNFPIKYFVNTKTYHWEDVIDGSMNVLRKYLPLIKTANKNNADIIIDVVTNPVELSKICGSSVKGSCGCAGLKNIYTRPQGNVYLSPSVFKSQVAQGDIIHEVLHALGIAGHSRDSRDLMHPYVKSLFMEGGNTIKINGYTMSLIQANAPRERDLNTLWLLYSQW